jgi:hypothetical protein
MLSRLIPRIGFAWTVRTVAFMSMGLLSFSILTVKARLPPRTGPTTHWLEPLTAIRVNSGYRWFVIACFFAFMGCVFWSVGYGRPLGLIFIPSCKRLWIPFFYISDFCRFHGFSDNLASYILPVMNAGSVIGRLIGFVADKWGRCVQIRSPFSPLTCLFLGGRFNLLTFGLFYLGVVVLAMLTTVSGHVAIIVYSVMFGLGSGTFHLSSLTPRTLTLMGPSLTGIFIALFPACTAQISPPELIGSRLGFLCFVTSFATLTGPPIAGGAFRSTPPPNSKYRFLTRGCVLGV